MGISWLVGGIPTTLERMKVSWDDDIPIYNGKPPTSNGDMMEYHNIMEPCETMAVSVMKTMNTPLKSSLKIQLRPKKTSRDTSRHFQGSSTKPRLRLEGGTLWWTNIAMENHHFLWENPLFLWPFSIAMLVHQRVFDGKGIYSPGSRKACCEARWSKYHPSFPPKTCYDYVWLRVHSEPMIVVILQYLHCPEHVFSTQESNSCYSRESTKVSNNSLTIDHLGRCWKAVTLLVGTKKKW